MLERTAFAFEIEPGLLGIASTASLGKLIGNLLPVVMSLGGLALFSFLVLGGFKYLTAGGDEKSIQEARKIIVNALVGLLIIFTAFWIVRIIETVLGIKITGF